MGARKRQIPSGLKRSVLPRLFTSWLDPTCIPARFGAFSFCISAVWDMRSDVAAADCPPQQLFFFSPLHIFQQRALNGYSLGLLLVRSISKGGPGHAVTSQVAASQPNFCKVSNLFSCTYWRSATRTRSTAVSCSPAANTVLSLSGLH